MEAIKGIEKEVSIEGKKRKIKIPPGIDEGTRIRFDDFILSVDIKPDEIFERDGEDIFIKLTISFSMAVLGGKLEVPTVDDNVNIRIRPGTKSGTMIRLRGKGAPRLRGRGRGDEYVKVNIAIPQKLSKKQRKYIQDMEKIGL